MFNWENKFWQKVNKTPECWEWTAGKSAAGYGRFVVNSKQEYTHRISWDLHNDIKSKGFEVCHTCDNPGCVNPEHLFLGTHLDNVNDMLKKGRGKLPPRKPGSSNGFSKLTEPQVLEIRRLASFMSQTEISRLFGVTNQSIHGIVHRNSWKHI